MFLLLPAVLIPACWRSAAQFASVQMHLLGCMTLQLPELGGVALQQRAEYMRMVAQYLHVLDSSLSTSHLAGLLHRAPNLFLIGTELLSQRHP